MVPVRPRLPRAILNGGNYLRRFKSITVGQIDQLTRLPNEIKNEIMKLLRLKGLVNLSRCNKVWNNISTPRLYKEDAEHHNSSAIRWAVETDIDEGSLDDDIFNYVKELTMRIIYMSTQFGGDVNAIYYVEDEGPGTTALHLAAALGRADIVQQLIDLGAEIHGAGANLSLLKPWNLAQKTIEDKLRSRDLINSCRYGLWTALFVPFIMGNEEIVTMLLKAGAGIELILEAGADNSTANVQARATITILHILAANPDIRGYDYNGQCYFESNIELIDFPSIYNGETALQTAIDQANIPVVKKLLNLRANTEVPSDVGRTALIQTIVSCYRTESKRVRQRYFDCMEALIDAGADVNAVPQGNVHETPLTATMAAAPEDWTDIFLEMKKFILLLIKKGADINGTSDQGFTIIHELCRAIHLESGSTGNLVKLLEQLVRHHGGDINLRLPDGDSLLKRHMVDYEDTSPKFLRAMINLGAEIRHEEASVVLEKWLECPKLQNVYSFNLARYKADISHEVVYTAYSHCFRLKGEWFRELRKHIPVEGAVEVLLGEAFQTRGCHKSQLKLAEDLGFDARWLSEDNESYLHLIIHKFIVSSTYTEKQALRDVKLMIKEGANICHRNLDGVTAIDKLLESRLVCKELTLCMLHSFYQSTRYIGQTAPRY